MRDVSSHDRVSPIFIAALGHRVSLEIEDASLREDIALLWSDLRDEDAALDLATHHVRVEGTGPWCITPAAAPREFLASYPHEAPDTTPQVAETRAEAVSSICAAINAPLATYAPLLTVHAAVVVRDGVGLVIPGRSGAGKTTLTVALLKLGWRYASDEVLALDWETGALAAYPRPLGISNWTAAALDVTGTTRGGGEWFVRAADVGARTVSEPFTVSHVVLPTRVEEQLRPTLASLHRMDAVRELLRRSFNHYGRPAHALQLVAALVASAQACAATYSDAATVAQLLTATFALE